MIIDFSFWHTLLDDTIVSDKDELCRYLKYDLSNFDKTDVISSIRTECFVIICHVEEFYVKETNTDKRLSYFKILTDNINQIREDVSNSAILNEYSEDIISEINKLESIIKSRFIDHLLSVSQSMSSNNDTEHIVLKWNGRVSRLAALFYDLMHTYKNSNNEYFISDTNDRVIKFIVQNFVNEKGDLNDEGTLRKYLGDGKASGLKRAKIVGRVLLDE